MTKTNAGFLQTLRLLTVLAAAILCFTTASVEAVSQATLQNDLNYYRKVSKAKTMSKNDRYYILLRIEDKYKDTEVNTTELQKEIAALDKMEQPSKGKSFTQETESIVSKIIVSETSDSSIIKITANGVKRSNYFLLKDPDPKKSSKIVLDLYGVSEKLTDKAKNINPKKGLFVNIKAGQFEETPEKIVRISAELRSDAKYRIEDDNGVWNIIAKKDVIDTEFLDKPQAVAVPVVAPAAAAEPAPTSTNTQQQSSYALEVGDVLGVSVYPAEELSREVIVQPDGNIPFPLIGSIKARGISAKLLATNLEKELGKYLSNPKVTITMRKFSRRQIFITGEVRSVGSYDYKENLRLMEFISSLGGFLAEANRKEIKVYRGPSTKRQTNIVNVEEIVNTGDFSKDFLLEPGDIVEVPKGSKKIAVLGDVGDPGYYDFRENIKLLELISQAGGFSETANITKISLLRKSSDSEQSVIKINLENILSGKDSDIALISGDTVFIPKRSLAKASWFITNVMPWLTLVSLILVVRGGV